MSSIVHVVCVVYVVWWWAGQGQRAGSLDQAVRVGPLPHAGLASAACDAGLLCTSPILPPCTSPRPHLDLTCTSPAPPLYLHCTPTVAAVAVGEHRTKLDVAKEVLKGMLDKLSPDDSGK